MFDRLQIVLNDGRWLQVSRSKRLSGKGPKLVEALFIDATTGQPDRTIELDWHDQFDEGHANNRFKLPALIELGGPDQSLQLSLTPQTRGPPFMDSLSGIASIVLQVSGSVKGMAFLDYQPLAHSLPSTQ